MTAIVLGMCAAVGVFLLLPRRASSEAAIGWGTADGVARLREAIRSSLTRSGLPDVTPSEFVGASVAVGGAAAVASWLVLGAPVPSLAIGLACSALPGALWRRRAVEARHTMAEAWPRMIEEVRVRVCSAGQAIPQAFLATGLAGPEAFRPAFEAARRKWSLTTDFEATLGVLEDALADPTADAVCETLLIVQQVGGDLDRQLEALAADRRTDLRHRREADARAAGARFARWFVVLVPAGMALAGLNLGEGREAYSSAAAQAATALAVAMVAVCWWWAGRVMAIPRQQRVFER